jgi:hypothetical protein
MVQPVKHKFASAKSDSADATLVNPSNWNDTHSGVDVYVAPADVSQSTVTPADITGLTFAIAASQKCVIRAHIMFQTAATTTGLGLNTNGPAIGTGILRFTYEITTTSAGATVTGSQSAHSSRVIGTGVTAANTTYPAYVDGFIENGTTAGTFALQYSSEVAASAVTVRQGSSMIVFTYG